MEKRVEVGQFVRSVAGRDRGQVFVVISRLDERHLAVADGARRRVARPKTKSARHLEPLDAPAGPLADRLRSGEKVSDHELRAALAGLPPHDGPAAGARAAAASDMTLEEGDHGA